MITGSDFLFILFSIKNINLDLNPSFCLIAELVLHPTKVPFNDGIPLEFGISFFCSYIVNTDWVTLQVPMSY